jgi:DNA-binding cell septation regulator SpoVG
MHITSIKMRTELVQRNNSRLVACGSIELDHQLRIEYIRVVKTNDGRFLVCMPSLVNGAGQHRDTVHPTNPDLRKQINDRVMAEVKRLLLDDDA